MIERRIAAMHKRFGPNTALYCRDCSYLISGEYHGRRYHKCEIYGLSHSESSDWRLSWMACGMYNVPQDMDGVIDTMTDEYLVACKNCKAFVSNSTPPEEARYDL